MQDISKYISQLAEDIQLAKVKTESPAFSTYEIAENEQESDYLNALNHITKPLSKIVGISKQQLPSTKQLSDQQSEILVEQIIGLLASHRIYSDFPNLLPAKKRYKLIYDYWDKEVTLKGKDHHIEFCYYSINDCPYQGFCSICDELKDE